MPRGPSRFVLALHRDYACRSTGACCTSGWEIALEPAAEAAIRDGLATGRLQLGATERSGEAPDTLLRPMTGLPDGARVTLGRDDAGCVFLEVNRGRLCAVHRQLGVGALPVACRQFPRLAVLEPSGTHVSLSHYCPTAAGLLFEAEASLEILQLPDEPGPALEGLDVRRALPPPLRPEALLSWEAHRSWSRHEVATLGRADLTPEAALRRLGADAESVRDWRAGEDLDERVHDVVVADGGDPRPGARWDPERARQLLGIAQAASARSLGVLADPIAPGAEERWLGSWTDMMPVAARYLAARAHASWVAQQGRGLRTRVTALWVALAVVRLQAARLCAAAERPLDPGLLLEAVRASDLLLVHLADPQALADRCALSEQAGIPEPLIARAGRS